MRTTTDHTHLRSLKTAAEELGTVLQGMKSEIDWSSDNVLRVTIGMEDIDPIRWLTAQSAAERVLWEARDGSLVTAGIGVADLQTAGGVVAARDVVDRMRQKISRSAHGAHYFGGLRFDDHRNPSDHWQGYGSYRFVLPRYEVVKDPSGTVLAVNLIPSRDHHEFDSICSGLRGIVGILPDDKYEVPQVMGRRDNPDRETWLIAVREALQSFQRGDLAKIVLARESRFRFDRPLDSARLMNVLRANTPGCFHILIQPANDTAFLSATPERLYSRNGRSIKSEALAGTRPRGETLEDDKRLGMKLLDSRKEAREHGYVAEHARSVLETLCRSVRMDSERSLVRLSKVQHMVTRFEGELQNGVDDHDLLTQLHPTPAVGGYPAELARPRLKQLETFDRGWYAGPIGWIGADEAEFAVGIRSGLVHGDTLRLYSGAGIVDGSHPEKEWDEIENKISTFLSTVTDR